MIEDDDLERLIKLGLVEKVIEEGEVRYRISSALQDLGTARRKPNADLHSDDVQ